MDCGRGVQVALAVQARFTVDFRARQLVLFPRARAVLEQNRETELLLEKHVGEHVAGNVAAKHGTLDAAMIASASAAAATKAKREEAAQDGGGRRRR